jgi:hypothetical protein
MLEGLTPVVAERKCLAGRILETLDKDDLKILSDALEDRETWTSHGLSAALGKRGLKIGDDTIRKHRDKVCLCSRT